MVRILKLIFGILFGTVLKMASSSHATIEECAELNSEDPQADQPAQKQTKDKSTTKSSRQKSLLYRLKKLRKKMEIYSRQIKKFNEESLTYNEMDREDSAYMKVDALQRRLLKTWEEFCRVQGMSPEIAINYDSKGFSGTKYEELNKKIDRLLDKSIDCFPDYVDVLTIVQRCTVKYKLPISSEEQGTLSRRLFQDVVKELKRRRQGDFINHFGSHLTDLCKGTSDPALDNPDLDTMLLKQRSEGEERMAKVIEEFVVKQETNPQGSSDQGAEFEDDNKESEKDEESEGQGDMESDEKNGFESDHSAVAEKDQQDSFEMTVQLGKDEATTEEGYCEDVTQDDDECDYSLDKSPSPLLPTIPEQHMINETESTSSVSATSINVNQQFGNPEKTKQEYSCDIIIID